MMLIEKWSFLDALWHTIITISTVGYSEVHPLNPLGRIFTMFIIVVTFGVFAYGASVIASMIFEGQLRELFVTRRMERMIRNMKGHTVVCGIGRTGMAAVRELHDEHEPFVVIDKDKNRIDMLKKEIPDFRYVLGDATEDANLLKTGIKEASNFIVSTGTDADTLFITLSAKNLNPRLRIVAKALNESNVIKLKRAGASEVVLPNIIGGIRMASIAVRPEVVSFLDIITQHGSLNLRIEEIRIPKNSSFCGKLLRDLKIPLRTGVIIIGLRRVDGSLIINPMSTTMVLPDDTLIIIGTDEQAEKLREISKIGAEGGI